MLDSEKLAQKQAELSKALSAAYLNHQISELESQVRQLPISQDVQQVDGHGQGKGIKQVAGEQNVRNEPFPKRIDDSDEEAVPPPKPARIDDDNSSERDLDNDERNDKEEDWRVAVVDVSGLMWAPKAVRSLVARGFEVVVPADGLRTLDLLKKGNTPSAIAARAAARYIEHVSRQYKLLSADPQVTVQLGTDYKRGAGLRIQRDDEFRKADELSSLPLMPGEEGPPKWVKSVLGCAAFFAGINKAELDTSFSRTEMEPKPVLYVANPPLAVELAQATNGIGPETKEMRDHAESNGIFLERGEGVVVLQEAERFELGLEVLRDDDDEVAYESRRGGTRGRGRGKNTGGGGGGPGGDRARSKAFRPKKEEEKQPEVKILLRRKPASEQPHSGPELTDNSPMSNVSALPDVSGDSPSGLLLSTNVNGLDGKQVSSDVSQQMIKTESFGSVMSSEISPLRRSRPLPGASDRKSPASKFVPLSRETHPVRRQATSSDSEDSTHHPSGGAGGRGRVGRGGAGAGGRGGRGGGSGPGRKRGKERDREREKDTEFKNGNFTLLQRPTPPPAPVSEATRPVPHALPSASKPPYTRTPMARPSKPTTGPTAPVVRSILARPTPPPPPPPSSSRGGAHGLQTGLHHGHGQGNNRSPHPSGPSPAFIPDMRGRGRGGRGGFRPPAGPGHPHVHGQGRGGHHVNPVQHRVPNNGFEFDDAMLRPGYGSLHHDVSGSKSPDFSAFRQGPTRAQAQNQVHQAPSGQEHGSRHHPFGQGQGQGQGNGDGTVHGPGQGQGQGHGFANGYGNGLGYGYGHQNVYPPNWRPAPEKSSIVVLQRPK